MQIYIKTSL